LGRPLLDEIVIRFVSDQASQVAALRSGSADLGASITYVDAPALQEAGLDISITYAGYNEGLFFLLDPQKGHPALQDVRVRQAIALGFDRAAFCEEQFYGLTQPAATGWDRTRWVDPTLEPWPYDPERARELLDEAGWTDTDGDGVRDKDGIALVLSHGTTASELRHSAQVFFQQQMAAIGVQITLQGFADDRFFAGFADGGPVATGQLDLFEYSSAPRFPDPDTDEWLCAEIPSTEHVAGRNWAALCDPTLDALLKAQSSQMDPVKRQSTFQEITRYIYEHVYWLGLWQDPDLWAVGPRLQNVHISAATPFFNAREWEILETK
jgi:peptide/nickel transport system substrate-binding protein